MKKVVITLGLCGFLFTLTSCQVEKSHYRTPAEEAVNSLQMGMQQDQEAYQQKLNPILPHQIKNQLIPNVSSAHNITNMYGKKFDIKVDNITTAVFFSTLAKETGFNIVVDPKVSGSISLNLKSVTITQILDTLRDIYGFEYHQTSYGFQVLPAQLESQTFLINYLDILRESRSYTQLGSAEISSVLPNTTSGDVSNNNATSTPSTGSVTANGNPSNHYNSSVNTSATIDFWKDLSDSLKALIGTTNGRSIVVNPESGTVIVKAYPNEIRQVASFIDNLQSSMSREVILEVKLLEVQLSDGYQGGIDWNVLGFSTQGGTNLPGPPQPVVPPNPAAPTPFTAINIHGGNFSSIVQLLQTQGNVQTIADPRVLTINNQQAIIKIGIDKFFVTGITTNVSNNGTSNTVTTASVALTPFFSGIILDITPQISRNDTILLHLHPVVSNVTQVTQSINIGGPTPMELPLASNNIREYDSIVRAGNRQVILIGGLTENQVQETVNSTPGLTNIPFFGALFRSTTQSSTKDELVILLRPIIIGRSRAPMSEQIPVAEERISELNRGFHAGSLPQVFGNEAELPQNND